MGWGGGCVGSITMQRSDVGQGTQAHKTTGNMFSKIWDRSKSREGIKSISLSKVKGYCRFDRSVLLNMTFL